MSITFNAFTLSHCSSSTITYTALLDSAALPSYITLTSSTRVFKIYTTSNDNAGSYTVNLTGSVTSSSMTETDYLTFTL